MPTKQYIKKRCLFLRKFKALRFISLLLIFMTLASIVNPYYVQATGLETPSISNPDNGEDYSIGDMKVNWQNCENADYYTVSLRDLTRDKLLIDMKKTTKSNYTISANNFTAGHQYRVAVGAFGNGSEEWDEIQFSIKDVPTPVVETPEISNPNEGTAYEAVNMKVDYTDDLRYVWRSIWIRIKVMVGEGTWSCMSN